MGRKRSPEYDYICRRCLVACELDGRHYRGGRSPRTCGKEAVPVLRSEWEAMLKQAARDAVEAIRWHNGLASSPGHKPRE